MDTFFLKALNMSITASWLILALVVLRPLLKKAPKWLTCFLWSLAGLRLLFPFSIKSVLSLIPSAQTVKPDILFDPVPEIHSGIPAFNQWVNPVIGEALAPAPAASVNPLQVWTRLAAYIWLAGILILIFCALFSYGRLRKIVGASFKVEDGVWISDEISSPFILGLIKPRIYLPSGMEEGQKDLVLAHERAHLARRDHWWKPLGFLILSLYWFNPLVWLAYVLLCRDIEMACDEKVIRSMGKDGRLAYSETLLAVSIPHRSIMACPLAFGEMAVKERIRKVLNYKKPAFWIIMLALIASLVLVICFLTNPKEKVEEPTTPTESSPGLVIEPGSAEEWFDYLHMNTMDWEGRLEISRPEFPGVTFRWTPGEMEAVTQAGSETLFQGMPIWNAFFCDLTGDGKAELCATVSFGSGLIDDHVAVFDYENKEIHYLWNRGVHDYSLYLEDGRLHVAKRPSMGDEILETGLLVFEGGKIAMQGEKDSPPSFILHRVDYQVSYSPVGYSPEGQEALLRQSIERDRPFNMDYTRYWIPVVKIESLAELDAFSSDMSPYFDFDLNYPDAPSFSNFAVQFTDDFFKDSALLITYLFEETPANRHAIKDINMDGEGRMEISIQSFERAGEIENAGWFSIIRIDKAESLAIKTCDAAITSTLQLTEGFPEGSPKEIYRFFGENLKDDIQLQLYDQGNFILSLSPLRSYLADGRYSIENGYLVLRTWDGSFTYTFDWQEDGWRFKADLSSPLPNNLSSIADGSLFYLVEKEPDQEEEGPVHLFLENLFSAVDQQAPFHLPDGMAVNEGVSGYIAGKIEAMRMAYEATNTSLQDYWIGVRLAETKVLGNNLVSMRFYVEVNYHYERLESVESGYGREVELLIRIDEKTGNTIVGIRVLGILDAYDSYLYQDLAGEGAIELSDLEGLKIRIQEYLQTIMRPGN